MLYPEGFPKSDFERSLPSWEPLGAIAPERSFFRARRSAWKKPVCVALWGLLLLLLFHG
jgi:hypothetical protein